MADATHHSITDGMTDEQRARIEGLMSQETFADGDVLLEEGFPAAGLFVLRDGRVKVMKRDMGGLEQSLAELGAPAILGEMELLCQWPCNATVLAKGEVKASLIPTLAFDELLAAGDEAAIKVMRNLARALGKKLSDTNELVVDLAIWK